MDIDVAVGEGDAHGGRGRGAAPGSGVLGSRVSPCRRARTSGMEWCGRGLMIRRDVWRYVCVLWEELRLYVYVREGPSVSSCGLCGARVRQATQQPGRRPSTSSLRQQPPRRLPTSPHPPPPPSPALYYITTRFPAGYTPTQSPQSLRRTSTTR